MSKLMNFMKFITVECCFVAEYCIIHGHHHCQMMSRINLMLLLVVKILQLKVEFVFKNLNFFLTFLSHLDSLIEVGKCTVLQIWRSQLRVLVCDTEWID